jgi:hypothetical protein
LAGEERFELSISRVRAERFKPGLATFPLKIRKAASDLVVVRRLDRQTDDLQGELGSGKKAI